MALKVNPFPDRSSLSAKPVAYVATPEVVYVPGPAGPQGASGVGIVGATGGIGERGPQGESATLSPFPLSSTTVYSYYDNGQIRYVSYYSDHNLTQFLGTAQFLYYSENGLIASITYYDSLGVSIRTVELEYVNGAVSKYKVL